jgi:hypothetical protein
MPGRQDGVFGTTGVSSDGGGEALIVEEGWQFEVSCDRAFWDLKNRRNYWTLISYGRPFLKGVTSGSVSVGRESPRVALFFSKIFVRSTGSRNILSICSLLPYTCVRSKKLES